MYKQYIEEHKDFPIEGINYLDLNPIYKDGNLLRTITEDCINLIENFNFDYIGLVESRGFILGSIISCPQCSAVNVSSLVQNTLV